MRKSNQTNLVNRDNIKTGTNMNQIDIKQAYKHLWKIFFIHAELNSNETPSAIKKIVGITQMIE